MKFFLFVGALAIASAADFPQDIRRIIQTPDGDVLIAGVLSNPHLATTPGAFQREYRGGECIVMGFHISARIPCSDVYVMRLDVSGRQVQAATYFGGSQAEQINGLVAGPDGSVYISGYSGSTDLLPGSGADVPGQFVVRMSPNLDRVIWARKFTAVLSGLAGDRQGAVYVSGTQCTRDMNPSCHGHVEKLDASGHTVWTRRIPDNIGPTAVSSDGAALWVTAWSPSGAVAVRLRTIDGTEVLRAPIPLREPFMAMAPHSNGGVVVSGGTSVASIGPDGRLVGVIDIGGLVSGLLVSPDGEVRILGAGRLRVPTTERSIRRCLPDLQNAAEPFVAGWHPPSGDVRWATFLPFNYANGIAPEGSGHDGMLVAGVGAIDAIRPSLFERQPPCLTGPPLSAAADSEAILNQFWSDPEQRVVAPGELVSLFGSGFRDDVRVFFNGIAAAVTEISANRVVAQVPYALEDSETARIELEVDGARSAAIEAKVVRTAPAVFGSKPVRSILSTGGVQNPDGTVNSEGNPAAPGDVVSMRVTGAGKLEGVQDERLLVTEPAPAVEAEVTAFIEGSGGQVVTFAGGIPGELPGLTRIDVRVAPDFAFHGRMILSLYIGGRRAMTELWIR